MKMPDRKMTVADLIDWAYENDFEEYLSSLEPVTQSDAAVQWEIVTEVMYRGTYNDYILNKG